MIRFWKAPLVAVLALGSMLIAAPSASAMVRGRAVVGGGFYRGGWYGPGWGIGAGWYSPGWYGAWGPGYYYGPAAGKVKIDTADKAAAVFVDGGYVGPVAKAKKFPLRPGNHQIELRDPNGQIVYSQEVNVIRGRTTEIRTVPAPSAPPATTQQPG